MRHLAIFAGLALVAGCHRASDPAPPSPDSPAIIAGTPRPTGMEGLRPGNVAFVATAAVVRREPSEGREVIDGKKRIPNFVAQLYRGEQVTPLGPPADPWLKVQLSDGKEGYVKADAVLGGDVVLATVLDRAKTFSRPDLLALNAGRQVEPGTLVFIVRAKEPFSEVNVVGTASVWLLTDVLVRDAREVEAAKVVGRYRILADRKDPAADVALDLIKSQYASTRLVQAAFAPPAADPNAAAPASDKPNAPADANHAAPP